MCRKYFYFDFVVFEIEGSPPHVREILHQMLQPLFFQQDHPRMCGKYLLKVFLWLKNVGSPPHVREILFIWYIKCHISRITPACAGNTNSRCVIPAWFGDHPRMCGKYFCLSTFQKLKVGSPPHVREIPTRFTKTLGMDRITPACAGNTIYISVNGQ